MEVYGKDCILHLAQRYPVLSIPLCNDGDTNIFYKSAALRGEVLSNTSLTDFQTTPMDYVKTVSTPAGEVETVFLKNRDDFLLFLRKTVYKGVCKPIPNTVGAMMIKGISNWDKINTHLNDYINAGNNDRDEEFRRFTSDKKNYKDCLLLISDGPYSNISSEKVGLSADEWLRYSQQIRIYHECTHFICRQLWNDKKNVVFDEIVADCIGLFAAFGKYSKELALMFLGFDSSGTYCGGRLEFYCEKSDIDTLKPDILRLVNLLSEISDANKNDEPFTLLKKIMESEYVL